MHLAHCLIVASTWPGSISPGTEFRRLLVSHSAEPVWLASLAEAQCQSVALTSFGYEVIVDDVRRSSLNTHASEMTRMKTHASEMTQHSVQVQYELIPTWFSFVWLNVSS